MVSGQLCACMLTRGQSRMNWHMHAALHNTALSAYTPHTQAWWCTRQCKLCGPWLLAQHGLVTVLGNKHRRFLRTRTVQQPNNTASGMYTAEQICKLRHGRLQQQLPCTPRWWRTGTVMLWRCTEQSCIRRRAHRTAAPPAGALRPATQAPSPHAMGARAAAAAAVHPGNGCTRGINQPLQQRLREGSWCLNRHPFTDGDR